MVNEDFKQLSEPITDEELDQHFSEMIKRTKSGVPGKPRTPEKRAAVPEKKKKARTF